VFPGTDIGCNGGSCMSGETTANSDITATKCHSFSGGGYVNCPLSYTEVWANTTVHTRECNDLLGCWELAPTPGVTVIPCIGYSVNTDCSPG